MCQLAANSSRVKLQTETAINNDYDQWGECSDKHMSRLSIAPQKTLFQNMHYLPDSGASCPEFIAVERKSDNKLSRGKIGRQPGASELLG